MIYTITARFADGRIEKKHRFGRINAWIDAAYDRGALGVTVTTRQALSITRSAPL